MQYINLETGDRADFPWSLEQAILLNATKYASLETCKDCGQTNMYRYVESNECTQCAKKAYDETWKLWLMGSPDRPEIFPKSADEALELNVDYYYRERLCEVGTHFSQPNIKTGKCVACKGRKETSEASILMKDYPSMIISREDAKALGSVIFRTGLPCRKGHLGYRYTCSGACIKCMRCEPVAMELIDKRDWHRFTVTQQLNMFIGYSKDNRGMTGPDGKRLNKTQFIMRFPYPAHYATKEGLDVISAWDAFIKNFTC